MTLEGRNRGDIPEMLLQILQTINKCEILTMFLDWTCY